MLIVRIDVDKPFDFSRLVIFQIGADTYNSTRERKIAVGDESGMMHEWDASWGGDVYRTEPFECKGKIPWISLHDAERRVHDKAGALANRGVVIREWTACLGGKAVNPWFAERGIDLRQDQSSTIDLVPPPDLRRLESGDFVEATIEHIVVPQFGKDYYGPNQEIRVALK